MTRVRAFLAASILVGFFVGIAAAMVLPWFFARDLGELTGRLLLTLSFFFSATVILAFIRVARMGREEPVGVELTPQHAPWLWQAVHELAAGVGTRAPDRMYVVPEVNASVSERTRLLGLLGGPRTLTIGLPLLQALTVAQLRAVLAHEMGHYSHRHTRLGPVVYRGVAAMGSVIHHVGRQSLLGRVLRAYASVYLLFAASVRRRQELEADNVAARLVGAGALAAALRELPGLDALWGVYLDRYVGTRWWADAAPDRITGGFPALVAAHAAHGTPHAALTEEPSSRWDSHPPTADRVAHLSTLTYPAMPADDRPAAVLLPDVEALADRLDGLLFHRAGHALLPWAEYTTRAAAAQAQAVSAQVLGEFARRVGAPSVTAGQFLDAVGTPAFEGAVRVSARIWDDGSAFLAAALAADAAVRCGAARWRHSWADGPAELGWTDGGTVDLNALGRHLVDPHTAAAARADLAARGVKLDSVVGSAPRDDRPAVLMGLACNVVVDGKRRDLLLYDRGILVIPGSRRSRMGAGKERLAQIAQQPLAALVYAPQSWYLPFDEVIRCVRVKPTLSGRALVLTGGLRTTTNGLAFALHLTMSDHRMVKIRWGWETAFIDRSYDNLDNCIDMLEARN